jgi:thiamine pyrophosphokinase
MSSHHIVREKQEPALFILDVDNFEEELIGQLLEWSPMVVVAANMYDKINSMGIKIDAIVCENKTTIHCQENIRFIYNKKPHTVLQTAIRFFISEEYPAVNIISNTFCVTDYEPYIAALDWVIFAQNKKYYAIKNGFKKWEVSNTIIYIFGIITGFYGLKKIDSHTYSTLYDGFFEFLFPQHFLFIAEHLSYPTGTLPMPQFLK